MAMAQVARRAVHIRHEIPAIIGKSYLGCCENDDDGVPPVASSVSAPSDRFTRCAYSETGVGAREDIHPPTNQPQFVPSDIAPDGIGAYWITWNGGVNKQNK